jgi:hypothetical protein
MARLLPGTAASGRCSLSGRTEERELVVIHEALLISAMTFPALWRRGCKGSARCIIPRVVERGPVFPPSGGGGCG